MSLLNKLDAATAAAERRALGWVADDVWPLAARVILGVPLIMNGIGQMAQPQILIDQMNIHGVPLAWMWPAILASLLGGWAIVLGWRIRAAAVLLLVYTVAATVLIHGSFIGWADKAAAPAVSLEACRWWVGFEKLPAASEEFIRGCGFFKTLGDLFTFQKHVTMLVPALLLLMAGGGRYSLEEWLGRKREAQQVALSAVAAPAAR